jgi:outer membrane lipoprotein
MRRTTAGRGRRHYSTGFLCAAGGLLLLGGCASKVPSAIREAPPDQPTAAAARAATEPLRGQAVRWGGELVAVRNLAKTSELEILARRLAGDGEPDPDSAAEGRFIGRVAGFVDPADYQTGDLITVAGVLAGRVEGKVGDYVYPYPVVEVRQWHRWPEPVQTPAYAPYPWPYHHPWWPYRPYGWPYYPYPWW